jgi:hypothetical protein
MGTFYHLLWLYCRHAPDTVHTGEVATVTEIQRCGSDSSKGLIREEMNALLIVTEK